MKQFLVILVVLVLLGVLFVWSTYNRIVTLDEGVNNAWAQVETVLQRRYDLIPNLVNTVKGYAKHEKGVFEEVARLRSQWQGAQGTEAKVAAATALEGALGRLIAVAENYPELKASQNFMSLQDELAGTENRISVERQRYNDSVRAYNVAIRSFPGNVIAKKYNFAKNDAYFQAAVGAKEAPKVEF